MKRKIITVSSISGIIAFFIYPLMISTHGYNWYNFLFEMSFGPLFIITSIGLYYFLNHISIINNEPYGLFDTVFNILAGCISLLNMGVQKAVFSLSRNVELADEIIAFEIYKKAFEVGNLSQLGMDYTFDVLVSIGTIFLSLALLYQSYFPRWLAIPGIVIGMGGLIINTIEFPIPPAAASLFDPGPFYAVFLFILLIGMAKSIFKKK